MITIVIMGIIFAIASSSWFGVVERRGVESANQSRQTCAWRIPTQSTGFRLGVVLVPDKAAQG